MNVLIVGLGSIAQKHLAALRNIYTVLNIYALRSSVDADEMKDVINLFDIKEIPSLKLDFIIISNPTAYHQQTIDDLIQFNLPLFIEKPVFHNLSVGDTLKNISNTNLITYIACNLRFLGCIKFVKDFIQGKIINEVNCYCGSYLPDWRPNIDFKKNYSAIQEMGGGVHLDLIHEIDYLYWFFGAPCSSTSIKRSTSSLGISAMDYAVFNLTYPNFCANVILNYYRRDPRRDFEILLDNGTILVDLLKNEVRFNSEIIYSSNNTILDTYEEQILFFINRVIKEKVKFNDINEAFEILKICI